jgi:hypothetical protein
MLRCVTKLMSAYRNISNYQRTPWSTVSLEMVLGTQFVKKPPELYLSMALQHFAGPWPLFQFLDL